MPALSYRDNVAKESWHDNEEISFDLPIYLSYYGVELHVCSFSYLNSFLKLEPSLSFLDETDDLDITLSRISFLTIV